MSRPSPPPAPVTTADRPECSDASAISVSYRVAWGGPSQPLDRLQVAGSRGIVPHSDALASISGYLYREKWNADLELDDLQTFVEVADAGGVSPAARRLGVSKSIVSRRLVRLEAELGIQLLARTTRGAALTEAGVTFRDHAARVCAEIDLARETILPAGDLRGRRRIGPIHGKLVASPVYVREHGAPETPDQLLAHQCLVQSTETWHFIEGDKTIAVHPQGR